MQLPEGQELPAGTYRELLAQKSAAEESIAEPARPATTFQLICLAEKMGRKYSTDFEAHQFKEKVQRMLHRRFA